MPVPVPVLGKTCLIILSTLSSWKLLQSLIGLAGSDRLKWVGNQKRGRSSAEPIISSAADRVSDSSHWVRQRSIDWQNCELIRISEPTSCEVIDRSVCYRRVSARVCQSVRRVCRWGRPDSAVSTPLVTNGLICLVSFLSFFDDICVHFSVDSLSP